MARLDLPGQHGRWRRWRLLPQCPPSVVVDVSGVSDFDALRRRPQPHSTQLQPCGARAGRPTGCCHERGAMVGRHPSSPMPRHA